MLIINEPANIILDYDISKLCTHDKVIYFDIETTGFSRKFNIVYLIGCMYFENNQLFFTQYMAEHPNEEHDILQKFYKKLSSYDTIIHFNGAAFDIPFLKSRGKNFEINFNFEQYTSIDLYKKLKPYAHILKLENLKQKTIEQLFNIKRNDVFSGGELVDIYTEYRKSMNKQLLKALLMHNMEDVLYMGKLTSILAFTDFFNGEFNILSYNFQSYTDINGDEQKELRIIVKLTTPLPCSISYNKNDIYITGEQNKVHISVKAIIGKLKYFFLNYKDYYYLPEEDMAMHKSVASYVDKSHRQNATPATCYINKSGEFLPLGTTSVSSFSKTFKKEYKGNSYIPVSELTDNNIIKYTIGILQEL